MVTECCHTREIYFLEFTAVFGPARGVVILAGCVPGLVPLPAWLTLWNAAAVYPKPLHLIIVSFLTINQVSET